MDYVPIYIQEYLSELHTDKDFTTVMGVPQLLLRSIECIYAAQMIRMQSQARSYKQEFQKSTEHQTSFHSELACMHTVLVMIISSLNLVLM